MAQTEEYRKLRCKELLLETEKEVRSKTKDQSKTNDQSKTKSKQGHHIINKGVINIYQEIILQFVRIYRHYIFEGKTYDDLKKKMIFDDGEKEALDFLFVNNPLSQESKDFIQETKVHENGWNYSSNNDLDFGLAKLKLTIRAIDLMIDVYEVLDGKKEKSLRSLLQKLRNEITAIFFPSSTECAYVDKPALDKWKEENRDQVSKFTDSKNDVRIMLENITRQQTEHETPLVFYWGIGAFLISKALSPPTPTCDT